MPNIKKRGAWNFGGSVPKNFVKHIDKSVPFYSTGHEIIKVFRLFLKTNQFVMILELNIRAFNQIK